MAESVSEKSEVPRFAPVDTRTAPSARPLRSIGEYGYGRNTRSIAAIAETLSSLRGYGRLPECELYTIGQLSAHLRVSLRTLRFYEQAGLLRPEREGTKRLYTRLDLDRLKIIVVLRDMEVSMSEIKALISALDAGDEAAAVSARVSAVLADLRVANDVRIGELHRLNARIETAKDCLQTAN